MRANDKSFNISIKENYQQDIPQMMVIPQDLSRAVLNLMNNACYAVRQRSQQEGTDYQPTIEVEVSASDMLKIQIKDNGIGMSDEVKQRLFENFFTTKPVGQGTGLGMGITRDIIENKHGGKLSFESTQGQGTCFSFTIPIKKA
jgi:signal transduction histidine kinase